MTAGPSHLAQLKQHALPGTGVCRAAHPDKELVKQILDLIGPNHLKGVVSELYTSSLEEGHSQALKSAKQLPQPGAMVSQHEVS